MPEMDPLRKSLITAVVLLSIVYLVAVPFYMHFEGWTLVEAFYFVSVTITTVGYGDVVPKTDIGRIFTVLVLFSGVSIFFYHVTHLGQFRERALDKQLMNRLSIFRTLASLRGRDEKTPKLMAHIGKKIGEV